ncbi:hypothetical protein JYT44_02190 [Caldithrix abyssi]|nr:hypothetical protein [Caldithrix abyssi]
MGQNKTAWQSPFRIIQFVKVLVLFSGFLFAQKAEPNDAYKTVLRMKLSMDVNLVLYLDEPKSAQLNKVYQSCVEYLELADLKATEQKLNFQAAVIKERIEKISGINYDWIKPVKLKQNIRYNYFSSILGEE